VVDFVSLSESNDTSTAMGKMVFTVLGAVAELERNIIRERVTAGLRRAKKERQNTWPASSDCRSREFDSCMAKVTAYASLPLSLA
jgi:DNA invertase Pin-like site-specific DNA recombinase